MRILLTGATGFIGRKIAYRLIEENHDLVILTRNESAARETLPFPFDSYTWDPLKEGPPQKAFDGVEAVIHLAGESVAAHRWTKEQKEKILQSRVLGTRHLIQGLVALPMKPSVFISASAMGYYGDAGDTLLTERSPAGKDFLAQVCEQWEKEVFESDLKDVRRLTIRIGVVLGESGGALEKLVPLFKLGLGGPVGNGRQWMSWIHLDDLVSLFIFCLNNNSISGPVNGVAPTPVTNRDFSRTLGEILKRPAFFPAPAAALKVALGEMATVILSSQRGKPETASVGGFRFKFNRLEEALSDLFQSRPSDGTEEFYAEQWIPRKVDDLFPFFSEAKNLETLTPPWLNFKIIGQSTPEVREGTVIRYQLKIHGIPVGWQSRIESWIPNQQFVDTQIHGPYALWHHTHSFETLKGGTLIKDRVRYRVPLGFLGQRVAGGKVKNDVELIFKFRRKKLRELFP